jgi:hypothetical protein
LRTQEYTGAARLSGGLNQGKHDFFADPCLPVLPQHRDSPDMAILQHPSGRNRLTNTGHEDMDCGSIISIEIDRRIDPLLLAEHCRAYRADTHLIVTGK